MSTQSAQSGLNEENRDTLNELRRMVGLPSLDERPPEDHLTGEDKIREWFKRIMPAVDEARKFHGEFQGLLESLNEDFHNEYVLSKDKGKEEVQQRATGLLAMLELTANRVLKDRAELAVNRNKEECDRRWPSVSEKVTDARKRYNSASRYAKEVSAYETAYKQGDYAGALVKLGELEKAAGGDLEKLKAGAKQYLEKLLLDHKDSFALLEELIAKGTPYRELADPLDTYTKETQFMEQRRKEENHIGARTAGINMRGAAAEVGRLLKARWDALLADTKEVDEGIKSGAYGSMKEPRAAYERAKQKAQQEIQAALSWTISSYNALHEFIEAVKAFRRAQGDHLLTLKAQRGSKKALRAQAIEFAKRDPRAFAQLAETKQGQDLIDELVSSLGGSAKSADDKKLCETAIRSRFGVTTLDGQLSTKALPRLYDAFKQTPLTHTQQNESLRTVKRNRESAGASFYRPSDQLIVLKCKRSTTTWEGTLTFDHDPDVPKDYAVDTSEKVNYFTHTTLHEIGHAVDDMIGFMDKKMKGADGSFGGWKKHTVEDVAKTAVRFGAMAKAFPSLSDEELTTYLVRVLDGKEKSAASAGNADVADLAKDPAFAEGERHQRDR